MSDASIFKGGRPVLNYMFCEGDYPQYTPPFENPNNFGTPPYDAHACGAYTSGYFTQGMPIRPAIMKYQFNAMAAADLKVGDIIRCIVVPADHYIRQINFKSLDADALVAGATVALTAQLVTKTAESTFTFTEVDDIEDALASQSLSAAVALDKPFNIVLSLEKSVGVAVGDPPTTTLYNKPLYVEPNTALVLGVRIVSLPTDPAFKIEQSTSGWYMSAKYEGFECPTNL